MSSQPVLFDAPGPRARLRHRVLTVVGAALLIGILWLVIARLGTAGQLDPALWQPFLTADAWVYYLIPGVIGTLTASGISVVLAVIFGLVFGIGRLARRAWIRIVSSIVVEFFRAVPVLLMMYFAFNLYTRNGVFLADLNPLMAVITGLTLYNGSVIAELVRSGVHALPSGQAEAGLSIGLTSQQTLLAIQLPQALVAMLPAVMGQLVVVIKDSALGYGITYLELLNWSKTLGSAYSNVVPAYLVAATLFILLNYGMTKLASAVEGRLRRRPVTAAPLTTALPGVAAVPDAAG